MANARVSGGRSTTSGPAMPRAITGSQIVTPAPAATRVIAAAKDLHSIAT